MGWRYIASRLNGDGSESFLEWNLPLTQVKFKDVLSGPPSLSAVIAPEVTRLVVDGRPLLERWSTAIYPELDGEIQGGFIVTDFTVEGEALNVEAIGFSGYPQGMAFVGSASWTTVDCLDVARYVWSHLQSQPMGNIGVVLPTMSKSGVTLGVPAVAAYTEVFVGGKWQRKSAVDASDILPEVSGVLSANMTATQTTIPLKAIGKFGSLPRPFEVSIQGERMTVSGISGNTLTGVTRGVGTTKKTHGKGAYVKHSATPARTVAAKPAEPFRLAEYETHDLGKVFDDMAVQGGYDYREDHVWNGEAISHTISFGIPTLGRRRDDLRFMLGENVSVPPKIEFDGDDYASEVIMLGAGEGAKMIRSRVTRPDTRIRRTAVVKDPSLTTTARAQSAAQRELAFRLGVEDVTEVLVTEHPNAPIGSFEVGDEIYVQVGYGWSEDTALWCRVLAITLSPESPSVATLSIARVDRIS
jgi:hypothetical protein